MTWKMAGVWAGLPVNEKFKGGCSLTSWIHPLLASAWIRPERGPQNNVEMAIFVPIHHDGLLAEPTDGELTQGQEGTPKASMAIDQQISNLWVTNHLTCPQNQQQNQPTNPTKPHVSRVKTFTRGQSTAAFTSDGLSPRRNRAPKRLLGTLFHQLLGPSSATRPWIGLTPPGDGGRKQRQEESQQS